MKNINRLCAACLLFFTFNLNVMSQTNPGNWVEGNASYPSEVIYTGAGFYYNEPIFIRASQDLLFDFYFVIYFGVQIKYDGGAWQDLVYQQKGSGFLPFTVPWTTPGQHTLGMRWIDIYGSWTEFEWTVYIMPEATKYYYDDSGNHMVMWDANGVLENPFLMVEGFDPLNELNENQYYAGANEVIQPLIANGYDVIVLQFIDGGDDLVQNAGIVKNAIQYLNSIKSGNEPNIVAGVSMGAVLSRYALAKAEDGEK
jgi:hypothetical protein